MSSSPALRALAYVRLSKLTETTTSPERQRHDVLNYIQAKGWELVDTIEDLDVSATRHRLARPGIHAIRRYFDENRADVVVVSRLDRIARNVADVSTLLDEGIAIASASEPFDTSTAAGRAMTQVAQVFAELEARTIGLRVSSSRAHLPTVGRWPGGPPPYGYTTAPVLDGPGKTLVIDPTEAAIVRRIVDEVLAGRPVLAVTQGLNADGIPPRRGAQWSRTAVARMLRAGPIRGYATTGGKKAPKKGAPQVRGDKVRDEKGLPLQIWPALITPEEGRQLDRIMTPGTATPPQRRGGDVLLQRLAICESCGRLMTTRTISRRGKPLTLYVCQTRGGGGICAAPQTVSAHLADPEAERQFLRAFGRVYVVETVQEAQTPEGLADVIDALNESTDAMRRPGADLVALAARIASLVAERDRLAAMPTTRAVQRRTGETFADQWARSTTPERRDMMLNAQAFVTIRPATRRGLFSSDRIDMSDRLAGQLPDASESVIDEFDDTAAEAAQASVDQGEGESRGPGPRRDRASTPA